MGRTHGPDRDRPRDPRGAARRRDQPPDRGGGGRHVARSVRAGGAGGAAQRLGRPALSRRAPPSACDSPVVRSRHGDPARDRAQLALIARFRARLPSEIPVRAEVPLPVDRDQRAWDLVLGVTPESVAVEAETRLRDLQALMRRIQLKQRDGGMASVVLLVNDTPANRLRGRPPPRRSPGGVSADRSRGAGGTRPTRDSRRERPDRDVSRVQVARYDGPVETIQERLARDFDRGRAAGDQAALGPPLDRRGPPGHRGADRDARCGLRLRDRPDRAALGGSRRRPALLPELFAAFPDNRFALTEIVVGPQGVFEVATLTGTNQGPGPAPRRAACRSPCRS